MRIIINGAPSEAPDGATVSQLLREQQWADKPVAVEVNLEVVPRDRHAQHVLSDGDQLEIVTLVGGG